MLTTRVPPTLTDTMLSRKKVLRFRASAWAIAPMRCSPSCLRTITLSLALVLIITGLSHINCRERMQLSYVNPDSQGVLTDGSHYLEWNSSEKYLAYLPHSGFHNQRIALENALTLARILNRTLLVPPVRLGYKPIRYVSFSRLWQFLVLSGKDGLQHCQYVPKTRFMPLECKDYFTWIHVPWNLLVDFESINRHQRSRFLTRFPTGGLSQTLALDVNETFLLEDLAPYDFRFLDTLEDASPKSDKFRQDISIEHLKTTPHRLIQLGTLFGSSRLRLKKRVNIEMLTQIRSSMAFCNPDLLDTAQVIAEALGGMYIGVHARLGDGHFADKATATVRRIWWQLTRDIMGLDLDVILDLESETIGSKEFYNWEPPSIIGVKSVQSRPHKLLGDLRMRPSTPAIACKRPLHHIPEFLILNTPLYISTDSPRPREDPALQIIVQTFPCAFFLSDFDAMPSKQLTIQSEWDGAPIFPFLMPILDAMVAAKGLAVVGTDGSTFSRFMEDVLWRKYHDLDIVQRG